MNIRPAKDKEDKIVAMIREFKQGQLAQDSGEAVICQHEAMFLAIDRANKQPKVEKEPVVAEKEETKGDTDG